MSKQQFSLGEHPGVLGEASEWIRSMWFTPDPNFSTYRLIGLLKQQPLLCEDDMKAMEFIIRMILFVDRQDQVEDLMKPRFSWSFYRQRLMEDFKGHDIREMDDRFFFNRTFFKPL